MDDRLDIRAGASTRAYVRWFGEIRNSDVPMVGGKNASLGEMYSSLSQQGVRVPNGFALTANCYREALDRANAWGRLHELLDRLDRRDVEMLARTAAQAREIVYAAAGGEWLRREIADAYRKLEGEYGRGVAVAVRSSATAEDLPTASFAGQHESFLHVTGEVNIIEACRRCFASIFTDRAIIYRLDNGFDHFKVALSVGVMKMVRSDLASSGVIFTLDTESGFRDVVLVTAAYGLGENIVQGRVDPDEFHVHKPTLRKGFRAVLRRSLGAKQLRMVYSHEGASPPRATSEPARPIALASASPTTKF
jgi:pyruvate,water dikinase